ncbi:hypothetical protein HPB51_022016 [Rhipicephalus microplus]|uniref:Uncharacterized protein n=1 Tax=Rhipicephalus microplus TaxID=6941 RepID=A0A9J6DJP8_RHIMP|nr:hypothetical protein HPB51_022016 [Rhipicephalus microplus]
MYPISDTRSDHGGPLRRAESKHARPSRKSSQIPNVFGNWIAHQSCFPYEKPWFAMLRNFENDPYVGGTAKCIRVTQAAPLQGHVTENVVEFGHTHRASAVYSDLTGWLYLHFFFLDIAENACTLFVPESQKNQIDPSCLFIFNLLCGGDKHYLLLDDSCTF